MPTADPFWVHVGFPDGRADGLRVATIDYWTGTVLGFPRDSLDRVQVDVNLDQQGIYVLRGPSGASGQQKMYVGRADTGTILKRLRSHKTNSDVQFWRETVAIMSDENVTPAPVVYLEARLIALAKQAAVADVGQNTQRPPALSPMQESAARAFLRDTLRCLRAIGFSEFGSGADDSVAGDHSDAISTQRPTGVPHDATKTLLAKGRDITAYAQFNDDGTGFILPHSLVAVDDSEEILEEARKARRQAENEGKVKLVGDGGHYMVVERISVSHETLAKQVVLGSQGRGRPNWEDVQGGD